jgi:hypothetical protein
MSLASRTRIEPLSPPHAVRRRQSVSVANFGSGNVMKLSAGGMVTGTYKTGDGPLAAVCSEGVVYVVNNGGTV